LFGFFFRNFAGGIPYIWSHINLLDSPHIYTHTHTHTQGISTSDALIVPSGLSIQPSSVSPTQESLLLCGKICTYRLLPKFKGLYAWLRRLQQR